MAVVLQIDLLPYVVSAVLGALSVLSVNAYKNWSDRRNIRGALYREITTMHDSLRDTALQLEDAISRGNLPWSESYVEFKRNYGYIQNELRAEVYRYVRATPALYSKIKGIESIDKAYFVLSLFNIECEAHDIKVTQPIDKPLDQIVELAAVCNAILDTFNEFLKTSALDKKLLLKMSDSAHTTKEYWEKLIEEPISDEQASEESKHQSF